MNLHEQITHENPMFRNTPGWTTVEKESLIFP
jgi:hypothetical protein